MTDELRVETFHVDGVIGVTVEGEIDIASGPQLAAALDKLGTASHVVLDFAGVTFMDSSGLTVLVMTAKRLEEAGRTLLVRNAAPNVRRVMEVTGLERLLPPVEEPTAV